MSYNKFALNKTPLNQWMMAVGSQETEEDEAREKEGKSLRWKRERKEGMKEGRGVDVDGGVNDNGKPPRDSTGWGAAVRGIHTEEPSVR